MEVIYVLKSKLGCFNHSLHYPLIIILQYSGVFLLLFFNFLFFYVLIKVYKAVINHFFFFLLCTFSFISHFVSFHFLLISLIFFKSLRPCANKQVLSNLHETFDEMFAKYWFKYWVLINLYFTRYVLILSRLKYYILLLELLGLKLLIVLF